MIITSPTLSSFPPSFTTTTTNTTRESEKTNLMSSTLSDSDRSLIEFTRCLYKAKAIVNELEAFGIKVMPTLMLDRKQYLHNNRPDFISHVDTYLGELFNRFHQMCNALLIVLKELESKEPLRRESIYSFHDELLREWHRAELIKKDLTRAMKQYKMAINDEENNNNINNTQTSSNSDNDTSIDCQSDTSPEPDSSESY